MFFDQRFKICCPSRDVPDVLATIKILASLDVEVADSMTQFCARSFLQRIRSYYHRRVRETFVLVISLD
jgi:hypothetical protein